MTDEERIRADAADEEREAGARRINRARAGRVTSASGAPPVFVCEACFEENCECQEEDRHEA